MVHSKICNAETFDISQVFTNIEIFTFREIFINFEMVEKTNSLWIIQMFETVEFQKLLSSFEIFWNDWFYFQIFQFFDNF